MKPTTSFSDKLGGLTIFRRLLQDPTVDRLRTMLYLAESTAPVPDWEDAYCDFAASLYETTDNLSDYLLNLTLEDENLYVTRFAAGREIPEVIQASLQRELAILQEISRLDSARVRELAGGTSVPLPDWTTAEYDFAAVYEKRLASLHTRGFGIFARYHVFTVHDGALVPVKYPDPQKLSDLTGYEKERGRILANTEALLAGKPANNALLYGDAGTGKSSTVKAIANAYKDQGLRLIEVKKNQLYQIPDLVESLSYNPLKFILFIDDLSFSTNDNDFSALKAILEGSVGGRSQNLVIYATSNRRHLIKETLTDREGDDIHLADTMQELMSLSARFGLTVTFSRPEKELYLTIVKALAAQYEIDLDEHTLCTRAEAHAIRNGGRSPRVARQFIELVKSGVQ